MRANRSWRLALILGGASGLAGAAVIPYVYALAPAPTPIALAATATAVQTAIACFLFAWAGLAAGRAVGLDAPLLRAWLDGTPPPVRLRTLVAAAAAGALVALVIVLISRLLPAAAAPSLPSVARWKSLLACSYGGVVEEVQLRLFVMTLLARLGLLLARRRALGPALAWSAIVAASLLFGAGHLPMAARLGALTPLVVARVVLLNGLGGIVFGWIYWRRGLEHAMASHFAADLVLHVALG